MICFNRSPGESRDPFDNILGAARWGPAFAGTAGQDGRDVAGLAFSGHVWTDSGGL